MKLNRKGYMMVEIILAFALAMGVALYLLNLTYDFKNMNEDIYQDITYVNNKVSITKNIMNDLDKGSIISLNTPSISEGLTTVDFSMKVNSESQNRRITIKKTSGGTIIYYGKWDGSKYVETDVSYYEKKLEKSLIVEKVQYKLTEQKDYLQLIIPIRSLYSDKKYDIKILIQCMPESIVQGVSYNYDQEFWSYRDSITKVVFQNSIHPISEAINSWDISSLSNKSVIAYLVPNDVDSNTYTVYIQGNERIIANARSSSLFSNFSALESIEGLNYFDTSNVIDMELMFAGCSKLTSLDLTNFKTNLVTNMYGMFRGCSKIKNLDLSGFNTENVTNMSQMFTGCVGLEELNLSSFNTSQVTNMSNMFVNCLNLKNLDLSHFDTKNVLNMSQMFYHCSGLETLNVIGWNTEKVKNMSSMFADCSSLTTLDLSSFNTKSVEDMGGSYKNITDTFYENSVRGMFGQCSNLRTLIFGSNFDTSNVWNMSGMFEGCTSLEELDLSHFDTKNVTNMDLMFNGTKNVKTLNLCSFNTEKMTTMIRMFGDTTNLENVYVGSGWITDKANISYMFRNSAISNITNGGC